MDALVSHLVILGRFLGKYPLEIWIIWRLWSWAQRFPYNCLQFHTSHGHQHDGNLICISLWHQLKTKNRPKQCMTSIQNILSFLEVGKLVRLPPVNPKAPCMGERVKYWTMIISHWDTGTSINRCNGKFIHKHLCQAIGFLVRFFLETDTDVKALNWSLFHPVEPVWSHIRLEKFRTYRR